MTKVGSLCCLCEPLTSSEERVQLKPLIEVHAETGPRPSSSLHCPGSLLPGRNCTAARVEVEPVQCRCSESTCARSRHLLSSSWPHELAACLLPSSIWSKAKPPAFRELWHFAARNSCGANESCRPFRSSDTPRPLRAPVATPATEAAPSPATPLASVHSSVRPPHLIPLGGCSATGCSA